MPAHSESQRHTTTHGAVKHARAEHYLLLSLVAFAASVIVTRLYLQLTGYPQIGGGNIHIAHLLWGGLLLYIAALLPLILSGSRSLSWSAILGGVGMGLFIDEVGKFITSNNDYFYPPAAPIIYAVFLLSVLLFVTVRRQGSDSARTDLFHVLEEIPNLIDGNLTRNELEQVRGWLRVAVASENTQLSSLGAALSAYVEDASESIAMARPGLLTRVGQRAERMGRRVGRRRHRLLILILTAWSGLQAIAGAISLLLLVRYIDQLSGILPGLLVSAGNMNSVNDMHWFSFGVVLQVIVGAIALIGFVLILLHDEQAGTKVATFSLLLSLTTVVLLTFYLNQFAAIATALGQFISLLIVVSYRRWYPMDDAVQLDADSAHDTLPQ